MKTRSKLMAALAMLLVSTIMMTTASFAWFTISTAPEVSNIKTTATTNDTLEIALNTNANTAPGEAALDNAGNKTTWGNLVDLKTEFATVATLKPVQLAADGSIKIPAFGLDGRLKKDLVAATAAGNGVVQYQDAKKTTWAYGIEFWMRSNKGGAVTLLTAAGTDRGAGENGLGSYLTVKDGEKDVTGLVKVAFLVGNQVVKADTGALPTGTIVNLTENVAQKVTVILYMDGEGLTNASFTDTAPTVAMNLQFTIAGLNGMDVAGSEHGRAA